LSITPDAIQKVAKLSRLSLSSFEQEAHRKSLNAIFDWIDQLQNVDVSSVSLHIDDGMPMMVEREDCITAPNRLKEVLQNAPESQHDHFSVPKMVE
jgi:aspartyl-tRNA(Asn)/glutamyl-tRNA(Gln) amidotransferase subunit C